MNPEKADQIRYNAMLNAYRGSIRENVKGWFLRHYEDPSHNTPYDSREGGYLYQWGGPYDASDVLYGQFAGKVEESVIEEAVSELEGISHEWERIPTIEDIDPADISSQCFPRFELAICSIRSILGKLEGVSGDPFMCSLLFAYTITSLEAYLSDAFLTCIKNKKLLRAFIESDPVLKCEKLHVSDIYRKMETLEGDALRRIQSVVFHRLEIVQRMYKDTLGIEFPGGMKELILAVIRRHDIIHRGCKDKGGKEFSIDKVEVETLVMAVEKFVRDLDERISKVIS